MVNQVCCHVIREDGTQEYLKQMSGGSIGNLPDDDVHDHDTVADEEDKTIASIMNDIIVNIMSIDAANTEEDADENVNDVSQDDGTKEDSSSGCSCKGLSAVNADFQNLLKDEGVCADHDGDCKLINGKLKYLVYILFFSDNFALPAVTVLSKCRQNGVIDSQCVATLYNVRKSDLIFNQSLVGV